MKITSASVTKVSGSGGFDILLMAYKVLPNTCKKCIAFLLKRLSLQL